MTRHAAYAVTTTGRVARHPFASFPHAEAARAWAEAHPGEGVRFVPALPATADVAACPECGHPAHTAGLCENDTRPACDCNTDAHENVTA